VWGLPHSRLDSPRGAFSGRRHLTGIKAKPLASAADGFAICWIVAMPQRGSTLPIHRAISGIRSE
jgi:hypothetical protein